MMQLHWAKHTGNPHEDQKAGVSRIYTNHEICSTTAAAMHKSNFNLKEIQKVTKLKNIQSLDCYVFGPTLEDKERYSTALYQYATRRKKPIDAPDSNEEAQLKLAKLKEIANENVEPIAPLPQNQVAVQEEVSTQATNLVQNNQNSNQVKQAPIMFGGATFNNCQITLNVPK